MCGNVKLNWAVMFSSLFTTVAFGCGDAALTPDHQGGVGGEAGAGGQDAWLPDVSDQEPAPLACGVGSADCNEDPIDGCEARLGTRSHCGGCNLACEVTETCTPDGCQELRARVAGSVSASIADFVYGRDGRVQVGTFSDGEDFGSGPTYARGRVDGYLLKYGPSGPDWFRTYGVEGGEASVTAVDVDSVGDVYVAGKYAGNVDFGDGLVRPSDGFDVFVLAYSRSGALRWVRTFGGRDGHQDRPARIIATTTRLYLVGRGGHGLDLGGGAIGNLPDHDYMFAASLKSTNGGHVWSRGFQDDGKPSGFVSVEDLAMDSFENLYVAGWWRGGFDIGYGLQGSALSKYGDRSVDTETAFITSLRGTNGALRWARSLDSRSHAHAVSVNEYDEVQLAGYVGEPTNFGAGVVDASVAGDNEAFVASYDRVGNLRWARVLKNLRGLSHSDVRSLAPTSESIVVSGTFFGEILVSEGMSLRSEARDMFLVSLDAHRGTFEWARTFGGLSNDYGGDVRRETHDQLVATVTSEGVLVLGTQTVEPLGDWTLTFVRVGAP